MVAGKLLVLPMRPGDGVVSTLLLGNGMDELSGWLSCAGSEFKTARNAITRTTTRENWFTGPPQLLICDSMKRNQRNGCRKVRSKRRFNNSPRRRRCRSRERDPSTTRTDSLRESVLSAQDDTAVYCALLDSGSTRRQLLRRPGVRMLLCGVHIVANVGALHPEDHILGDVGRVVS